MKFVLVLAVISVFVSAAFGQQPQPTGSPRPAALSTPVPPLPNEYCTVVAATNT